MTVPSADPVALFWRWVESQIERYRAPKATRLGVLLFVGKHAMNPITVGAGSTVVGVVVGLKDDGAPGLVDPCKWDASGLDGVEIQPSVDSYTAVIQLPPDAYGSLAVTVTTVPSDPDGSPLSATGAVNVTQGKATRIALDFTLQPTPQPSPPVPGPG